MNKIKENLLHLYAHPNQQRNNDYYKCNNQQFTQYQFNCRLQSIKQQASCTEHIMQGMSVMCYINYTAD
jgi:hypothetical protein